VNRWMLATAVLVTLLAGLSAAQPLPPTDITHTIGNFWVNHTWYAGVGDGGWYLISGAEDGGFNGSNWTGSTWQDEGRITNGIDSVVGWSTLTTFQKDGTWYLISGERYGTFQGYNWTGSTWQADPAIATGLGDIGLHSAPTVFQKDGTWHLISGDGEYGTFHGYNWTGYMWQSDSTIVEGTGTVGYNSIPTVFQKDGTWYLISGEFDGVFNGYNWTGSTWQADQAIATGLGDAGSGSAPTVFQKDGTWYLISGEGDGVFNGYNWTGSTWQADPATISGLSSVPSRSKPMVFFMVVNDTDSYNVSVTDVWHNGTTNTYFNNSPLSPHAWSNVTVFAFNDPTGLSSGSISQDVQIPNNPVTITNINDWSGYENEPVTVDCNMVDVDLDTPTFSCDRTDLFTDFDTSTGEGNWAATPGGTYNIDFGVSDGYGSTDNTTMTIHVTTLAPSEYVAITNLGIVNVNHKGVVYVYINNPALLPCTVSINPAGTVTPPTGYFPDAAFHCDVAACVDKHWANGEFSQYRWGHVWHMSASPLCTIRDYNGMPVSTSMEFTHINDYFVVYGFMLDSDSRCWRCSPDVNNSYASFKLTTTSDKLSYIILHDSSGNLVQNAQVSIHNIDTGEITDRWNDVDDGIIDMGETTGSYKVAVRTFDGVFVHTCDLGANTVCEIVLPIHYNVRMYPVDWYGTPLTNVFAGLAEYTSINPSAFWGMDLSDQGYVPVTNCSGFAMCDIIAEKEGYIDYKVEALNWTSKSALVKDYRHNIVMEEE